jgi:uncharacterized cupredoxin-like copper-binding protein
MSRLPSSCLALGATALLAGCGSSGSGPDNGSSSTSAPVATAPAQTTAAAGGAAQTVRLAADESGGLYFDKKKLTAKAGKVTVVMANPASSGKPHAIAVEGNGVDKDGQTASPGSTSTVTVVLKPGRYGFYCPVDGHEAAGMKGTLTVT